VAFKIKLCHCLFTVFCISGLFICSFFRSCGAVFVVAGLSVRLEVRITVVFGKMRACVDARVATGNTVQGLNVRGCR